MESRAVLRFFDLSRLRNVIPQELEGNFLKAGILHRGFGALSQMAFGQTAAQGAM